MSTPTAATAAPTATPVPAVSPTTVPSEVDAVVGAESLKDAVAEQSLTIGGAIEWLDAMGVTIGDTRISLWSVLVVLMVILAVYLMARIGVWIARNAIHRMTRLDATQRLLAEKIVSILIWAVMILIGIDILGIDLTALAVFSGAFGLAIGFGLQKTFGNLIAGIILLTDRSIKPGDVIAVSDMSGNESFGQIRRIGIRAISIITRDRKEYLIPNENLMINQVENWSYSSRDVRVKAPVGVAYGSDLDLVEKLLLDATVGTPRVLEKPEPAVRLMGFGDNSINFEVRFWISDPEEGVNNVRSDVFKNVWRAFQQHGVEIPFPQRDLNLKGSEQFEQLLAAIAQRQEKSES
ncbi:mechanosensitive ion channel family protein [Pelagerythrobacter aerophilus]|uniref:Mechanosensitive ion channel protein n=1 Tax=Pelagerythrobacter aerophilus TaxID=2306995 RepID=A0A418NHE4_9SPHN|nr:mechanosensitive ion channel domain-containing protein [Pelagerythrobacter aerophilus]RIV78083.1 mechanosensitive ion channel protein [Pelagerythrobacter aerophilus]